MTFVGPVFVIVVEATAAKFAAESNGGVVAAAWAAGTAIADSATAAQAAVVSLRSVTLRPSGR